MLARHDRAVATDEVRLGRTHDGIRRGRGRSSGSIAAGHAAPLLLHERAGRLRCGPGRRCRARQGRRRRARSAAARSSGNSSTHGPHHVAQKFTITGRPRRSARRTGLPSRSTRRSPAPSLPMVGSRRARRSGEERTRPSTPSSTSGTTAATTRYRSGQPAQVEAGPAASARGHLAQSIGPVSARRRATRRAIRRSRPRATRGPLREPTTRSRARR